MFPTNSHIPLFLHILTSLRTFNIDMSFSLSNVTSLHILSISNYPYTHTHTYKHTHTHTHTHTHKHIQINTPKHTRIYTHAHTNTRTYTHTHTHTHIYTNAHTHIHTLIHTHTQMHTHTYTHPHPHTQTHKHTHTTHLHTKLETFVVDLLIAVKAEILREAENITNLEMDKVTTWAQNKQTYFKRTEIKSCGYL